jgi:CheY-like chemotaxis protein
MAPTGGNGLRVLLVDDNLLNQVYGEALIERLGFRVTIAADGAEAVRRWKTELFDLILMDCHMPVMDGFAAARRIREGELDRGTAVRTPIVALTGCTDGREREECIDAGMDAVLRKPFNPDELLAFVNEWSENNQASSPRMPAKYAEAGLLAA